MPYSYYWLIYYQIKSSATNNQQYHYNKDDQPQQTNPQHGFLQQHLERHWHGGCWFTALIFQTEIASVSGSAEPRKTIFYRRNWERVRVSVLLEKLKKNLHHWEATFLSFTKKKGNRLGDKQDKGNLQKIYTHKKKLHKLCSLHFLCNFNVKIV